MVQNQGLIGDEDHIVRVEDLGVIGFFFLFLRLAELEDLVETVQDLIACPLIVDKATDIHVLQGRMRQPAHPIPAFFFLFWNDRNNGQIMVRVKDSQLGNQKLQLLEHDRTRANVPYRSPIEASYNRKIVDLLMGLEKGIAFFFQGIFLPTAFFLTIFELIAGWNLAQAQTIGQKVKMKRCFFVDPRVIAFDHLSQVFDGWEMVKHAFSLLPRELLQVLGLVLEIEMVELHALFLIFFVFLTILEKSLYRKDHTDHRHGYRRDDIETPRLENSDQEGHPNHDEGGHDQLQEFIGRFLGLRTRRIDQDLVF